MAIADHRAIKLKGANIYTPSSYSTIDDAVYVRVVSYSSGGQNFRVANDSSGTDVVARYAVGPLEVLYIKKEPGQYLGGGGTSMRCSAVSVEG